jgi:hypothetical protein
MDYFGYDLTKERHISRLTKKISSIVRKAPEYEIWASKKRRGYTRCPLRNRTPDAAKPEVHHEPLTLYEIIYNRIIELIENEEILNYSPTEIAYDILAKHLDDKVDSITICELCHKEIHNLRKVEGKISEE